MTTEDRSVEMVDIGEPLAIFTKRSIKSLELRDMRAFVFVWASLNKTAMSLKWNVSLKHLNHLKYLNCHESWMSSKSH